MLYFGDRLAEQRRSLTAPLPLRCTARARPRLLDSSVPFTTSARYAERTELWLLKGLTLVATRGSQRAVG